MAFHRTRQALVLSLVGVVLTAAITGVSAQEITFAVPVPVVQAPAPSSGPALAVLGAAAIIVEDEPKVDVAMIGDETIAATAVAQAVPPAAASGGTAASQPILVNERAWSDEHKTYVECTGDVARTCQVNVYGPGGEFILGRKISPNGEAVDCSGPCLDSTGAPLDAASVSRAKAAVAAGSQTHKVITSAGIVLPPPAEEVPTTEAERLNREGD